MHEEAKMVLMEAFLKLLEVCNGRREYTINAPYDPTIAESWGCCITHCNYGGEVYYEAKVTQAHGILEVELERYKPEDNIPEKYRKEEIDPTELGYPPELLAEEERLQAETDARFRSFKVLIESTKEYPDDLADALFELVREGEFHAKRKTQYEMMLDDMADSYRGY